MYQLDSSNKKVTGILMKMEEDPNSRYRFEIWFDYTREIMNTISEGAMIIIPNFFMDQEDKTRIWFSILEVTMVFPIHYAISQATSGFPGFLVEAAKSASNDWIDQESISTDDTTKIRCMAVPTNLMMLEDENNPSFREEEGLPMVGSEVILLNSDMTERLVNLGIEKEKDDIIKIGPLIRDKDVNIFLRNEETLRTHFAIFGFTGAGKSNLLSTLISKIFEREKDKGPVKIVVFDLMSEFSVLLLDLLSNKIDHNELISLGAETLPESVLKYYSLEKDKGEAELDKATKDIVNTSLYPKALKGKSDKFYKAYKNMLKNDKIKIWEERERRLGELIQEHKEEFTKGNMGNEYSKFIKFINHIIQEFFEFTINKESIEKIINKINLENFQVKTTISNKDKLLDFLNEQLDKQKTEIPSACQITIPKITKQLNEENQSSLIVIQSADPDKLRDFAFKLGRNIYENRRKSGQISPLVSFIFDEADEFIPLNVEKESSYARSSYIAMTLARRGRKFGLGIGIATQRVTYLNTSIMAQPHTYFISKLPRKSDRERVCEAFGISEDMFRQTFKFKKGNWLLVSHDATGLDAVPLPIKTDDANIRLKKWLDSI